MRIKKVSDDNWWIEYFENIIETFRDIEDDGFEITYLIGVNNLKSGFSYIQYYCDMEYINDEKFIEIINSYLSKKCKLSSKISIKVPTFKNETDTDVIDFQVLKKLNLIETIKRLESDWDINIYSNTFRNHEKININLYLKD